MSSEELNNKMTIVIVPMQDNTTHGAVWRTSYFNETSSDSNKTLMEQNRTLLNELKIVKKMPRSSAITYLFPNINKA